ncbi:hypothetical protein CYY_008621 [Polysphondylium violaceum]|uniref:NUDE domain-containing protein n=1 Tax=Polysphondylium violaceum TaxID=133409 RepID=A0A8J4V3R3_9MYCE|nr:hypothetical protein CYY_008621 [Polysphondylium violaceum]
MATVEIPSFSTPQEEIQYWKKRLEEKQQEMDELETSFNEYQDFSKQLEEEMESELKAYEKKYNEIQSQHVRLKNDYEKTLDKLNEHSRESSRLITSLQDEVTKLQTLKQSLMVDKRKLEQDNDYLERRERASDASVHDLSDKLNKVMEENVWMQSELEESKQIADETIQRLRDDIRDLRNELTVRERKPSILNRSANSASSYTSEKSKRENPMSNNIPRPMKSQRQKAEDTASSSARAASLVVVSDLINLVSDLEAKIANYRKPNGGYGDNNSGGSNSSMNSINSFASSPTKLPSPTSPVLKHSNSFSNIKDIPLTVNFFDASNNHNSSSSSSSNNGGTGLFNNTSTGNNNIINSTTSIIDDANVPT